MSLEVDVTAQLGDLALEVAFESGDGITALVGPNGAGKTTLLRAVAGFVPLERGRVLVDGQVLDDVAAGVHLDPDRRPLALMFQQPRLFASLSVLENAAFGLRAAGVRRAPARAAARAWLDRVGMGAEAAAHPVRLSGGQAQRVALARTMVLERGTVLLDEPLAAVDRVARAELQGLLRDDLIRRGGSHLVVTHDRSEADALADRVLVLRGGRLVD